jgi:phage I-like protein
MESIKAFLRKLFAALGIEVAVGEIESLATEDAALELFRAKFAEDLVAAAIANGKLLPGEVAEFRPLAEAEPAVFLAFLRYRRRQTGLARFKPSKKPALSEIQRQINSQLGVSDETFLKYQI